MQALTFQTISEQQQTQVLRYLQATNSDDLQAATQILHQHQFNSQAAISHHFNQSTPLIHSHNRHPHPQPTEQQQRQLTQYIRHLQRLLQQRTLWRLLTTSAYSLIKVCLKGLSHYVLPECIKSRFLRSKFERLYRTATRVRFEEGGLEEVLRKGRMQDKPCAIVMCQGDRVDRGVMEVLGNNEVVELMNLRFVCYGVTVDSKEVQALGEDLEHKFPSVLIIYQTIFDKTRILKTFYLGQQQQSLTTVTPKSLTDIITKYRSQRKHQKNIIIRYNNLILSHWHDQSAAVDLMQQQIPQDDSHYQTDRQMLLQQQRQYQQAMQQSKILQQKRQKELQQQRLKEEAMQSIVEERKVRKLSIPEEPSTGEIVRLVFRCPNGQKVVRNFERGEKLELVYHWVETNQGIQFEEEERKFELLHVHGYPPVPLGDKKDKALKDIFEEQTEQLVIKQL